jgi:hypothetical protein
MESWERIKHKKIDEIRIKSIGVVTKVKFNTSPENIYFMNSKVYFITPNLSYSFTKVIENILHIFQKI